MDRRAVTANTTEPPAANRSDEDPTLASRTILERQARHEQRHGEADARQDRYADEL
jgi:hypothetical protein